MAHSDAPQPVQTTSHMNWNAGHYLKFGGERLRPAIELLGRIPEPSRPPERIIDLGCGPGNSTTLLASRWPRANITGLDNSPPMIERAHQDGPPGVDWREGNISAWAEEDSAPQDIIYANAALHWCPNHNRLFECLMKRLSEGGVLAAQMPRNFSAPSHTILHGLAEEQLWRDKWNASGTASVRDPSPVATPDTYYDMLSPIADTLDIWETTYLHVLDGEDAVLRWTSGTALLPYVQALSDENAETFRAEYGKRLRKAYPQRADGHTLFPFKRVFIVATAR
ncbi:MAG: methyltransferase domain-containing protein [Parvularculales bacterium]